MATGQYIGVDGVARKVTTPYIGVEGVARKVTNGYVGVDGVARLFFSLVEHIEDRAVLTVAKQTATTYAGETQYANENFILLDIYPQRYGTVTVTYGGLTKTIKDTSGAEEPNAQEVFFGTFNGVTDSVDTPASGTLIIEGDFAAYGNGHYSSSANKTRNTFCVCITEITEIGKFITSIPNDAFRACTGLTSVIIPESVTTIGSYAFYGCTALTSISTLKCATIGSYAFYGCYALSSIPLAEGVISIGDCAFILGTESQLYNDTTPMYKGTVVIPSTVESIGNNAFTTSNSDGETNEFKSQYLYTVQFLSTIPPTFGGDGYLENAFGRFDRSSKKIIVPTGSVEAYKATLKYYSTGTIVEAS